VATTLIGMRREPAGSGVCAAVSPGPAPPTRHDAPSPDARSGQDSGDEPEAGVIRWPRVSAAVNVGRVHRRASAALVGYGGRSDDTRSVSLARSGEPTEPDPIHRDEVLMATVAEGDQGAFAVLARAETPRLLRFTRSLVAPAEAEEVVQESLLRLWQQAETWQPNGRVSTWLHQVAYRLCIDRLRRRRPSVGIEEVQDDLEDPDPAPDQRLIRVAEAEAVRAAINALPERQRVAILLCHFQELSQAEASAVMEIGEEAYESLLARGRRRLRALLAENSDGGETS
jgi:RNA polymerase sigma-70 factor (ECF subfamily)